MDYVIIGKGLMGGVGSLLEILIRGRRWASPDFQSRYGEIERWHCELSCPDSVVMREIGIDATGNPVALGPIGRNAGMWVGMSLGSLAAAGTPTSKESFEDQWQAALNICGSQVREEVRWLVTRAEIVGLWTTAGFGSATEEDIEFFDDGLGTLLARNGDVFLRDSFRWEVPQSGVVVVDGETCTDLDEEGRPRSGPSRLHFDRRNVTCRTAYDGSGQPHSVLELDVGVEPYGWVHGPFWRV